MYQGHHPDGSSVQNHSVGGIYPFVLVIQEERPDNTGWFRAIIQAPDGSPVHAEVIPGPTTPEDRMAATGRARLAAGRLKRLHASGAAK